MTMQSLPSVCPHDCPSACALDVAIEAPGRIGRIHGAAQPFTDGVVCAKTARYAERVHHADRLRTPMRRVGAKGEGRFAPIGWDEALDEVADAFRRAADKYGPETIWPYFYGGTMGHVQRGAVNRLRDALGWSGQLETICASIGGAGWQAGVGAKRGVDLREVADAELVVVWGGNPVVTNVNLMGLIAKAKRGGAKLVVVDPYRTQTARKADHHLALRPGTDAALACAVMHVQLTEGLADRAYLARLTDFTPEVEAHLAARTPAWAAAVTGLDEADIVAFARLYGSTKRSFLRLSYGMSRTRNGAASVHAVSCLPAVSGAWAVKGGGAALSMSGVFTLKDDLLKGPGCPHPRRILDMSRIGPVLMGDSRDLGDGPPVTAIIVQNANPAVTAPQTRDVRQGLARDDLFLCVHEQLPTETAAFADILLPATTFLEHEDLYTSYGHSFLQSARPVIPPVGESRPNHWVIGQLARRLGVHDPALEMSERQVIDAVLQASGLPGAEALHDCRWIDLQVPFETSHFLDGFGHPDGKFRFRPDWSALGAQHAAMPTMPDHMAITDEASARRPFRLVTAPSPHFLNSSFTEMPTSRRLAQRPTALLHPEDCALLGVAEGGRVRLVNDQGSVVVAVSAFDGLQRGVAVVEGIWPNAAFEGGWGINTLTSADAAPPFGGAVFHDTAISIEAVPESL